MPDDDGMMVRVWGLLVVGRDIQERHGVARFQIRTRDRDLTPGFAADRLPRTAPEFCDADSVFIVVRTRLFTPTSFTMTASLSDEQILALSDEEIDNLYNDSPKLSPRSKAVVTLSNTLVAKQRWGFADINDEVCAMETAQNLGIRVPKIHRVVKGVDGNRGYIIMDLVPSATTLEDLWPSLSVWAMLCFALQLRGFIKRMRSVTSPTLGGLVSGQCKSIFLDDYYGLPPHATPEVYEEFLRFWTRFQLKGVRPSRILNWEVPHTGRLVFTHQDLAPRNVVVDENDKIWLVDWGFAGWFPAYFEYTGMQNLRCSKWSWFARLRWQVFSWMTTGWYTYERIFLETVEGLCVRFRIARKKEPCVEEYLRQRSSVRKCKAT
jgi:Phosphotransferase enzyme family